MILSFENQSILSIIVFNILLKNYNSWRIEMFRQILGIITLTIHHPKSQLMTSKLFIPECESVSVSVGSRQLLSSPPVMAVMRCLADSNSPGNTCHTTVIAQATLATLQ